MEASAETPAGRPLLAEDLLRVALQANEGALPRRGLRQRRGSARRLDVVLRAALFCDLAQRGAITGVVAPAVDRTVAGETVASDRILNAVAGAVARRPDVPWARWFTHLNDDRAVLVDRLVGTGKWTAAGGVRYVETVPAEAERLLARTYTVSELVSAPADARETALGYLFALTGPAMTAERLLGWDVRLTAVMGTPGGTTVRAVLTAARSAARPGWRRRGARRRRRGSSGRT
jgi:hypothetical protein